MRDLTVPSATPSLLGDLLIRQLVDVAQQHAVRSGGDSARSASRSSATRSCSSTRACAFMPGASA